MKKRVFSILTALCLCLTLLPTAALATEDNGAAPAEQQEEVKPEAKPAEEEKEAQEGPAPQPAPSEGDPVALSGEGETVITLTQDNISTYVSVSSGLTDGSYQLTEDITINSSLNISGTVTLDLNNHVLKMAGSGSVIQVNGTLTLIDSAENKTAKYFSKDADGLWTLFTDDTISENTVSGGVITGGTGSRYTYSYMDISNAAGGVYVGQNSTFHMAGGSIVGCTARQGGGVYVTGGTINTTGGSFTMTGGNIVGCLATTTNDNTYGGGIYNSGATTLSGSAAIWDCHAIECGDGKWYEGGGVRSSGGSLTISGDVTIRDCTADAYCYALYAANNDWRNKNVSITGGTFYGSVYLDRNTSVTDGEFTGTVINEGGEIKGGTFHDAVNNYGRLVNYTNTGTIENGNFYGAVNNTGGTIENGTFYGTVTNKSHDRKGESDPSSITGGTFYGSVINEGASSFYRIAGSITGGTFKKDLKTSFVTGVGEEDFVRSYLNGLGTTDSPFLVADADDLKLFRDVVNGKKISNSISLVSTPAACAELTANIALDSDEEWTPISEYTGKGNDTFYKGTFDGGGYTISGLKVSGDDYVGLFGCIKDATIKNLKVSGKVTGKDYVGGIVGRADGSAKIQNCHNYCEVESSGGRQHTGGIVGYAKDSSTISDCGNVGKVSLSSPGPGEYVVGGVVGWKENGTVQNCYNMGQVSGTGFNVDAGGIVGYISNGGVQNCYNEGAVSAIVTQSGNVGGVVSANYQSTVQDCYNVGALSTTGDGYIGGVVADINNSSVQGCYNVGQVSATVTGSGNAGGVAGWKNSGTVQNCYYLKGTAEYAVGGAADEATTGSKTAAEFADGTVLTALIAGRVNGTHPWAAECKYLAAAGRTLPVLAQQKLTVHDHNWGAWTSNGDGTHTRTCACGVVQTGNCAGGTATCNAKAACATCKQPYGELNADNHANLVHVPAKAATTREEGNIEYWHCEACGKYYSDTGTKNEITQAETVISKRHSSGGSSSYPITVPDKTENGSVSVSPKNASKGSTVTVTVEPDSGYVLETISVTDKNGNDLKLTNKGDGKYTFTMPGSKVEIKVTFMEDNSVLNFFYDVPNDAYYYEAVKWAVENGITGGVGNSLFAPNQPCTRAQIVTFLWRAAGSPVVNYLMPFTDVDESAYYAEAVRWAASTGIVAGLTETTFGTNDVCTRAQAATMIYRYAQAQGKGFTGAWMFLLPFTDVPEWAYESVAWCYMNGVTTGVSETAFAPGNDCTRAQIVTFLWRAFSK